MTPQEEALFNRARLKIEEQQDLLRKLTAPAWHVGTVIAKFDKRCVVDAAGQVFEVERSDDNDDVFKVLQVGNPVDIHPATGQIVKASSYIAYGQTGLVVAVQDNLVQVSLPQGVVTTEYSMVPVALGDKVVMNNSNHVILKRLQQDTRYKHNTQAILDWDDIGAAEDAKKELIAALETPYTHSDIFTFFNKERVKGALLWGRPGNGKTMLGRAAAGALARMHGKEAVGSGFIYIKGPEILDKYVGETESQIREPFAYGREHFKKHGYPCVIFIDEGDAIFMRRGSRTSAGMEQTIVPMFNAEMDGIEESGVFVLVATNRADILDPAIIRPGRLDRKIYVAPPTKLNAPEIWDIHMKRVPMAKGVSKEQVIQATNDALYSDQYPLYYIESAKGKSTFALGNLVSGALIAGVVERASSIAIDRNVAAQKADTKTFKLDGLRQEDFTNALAAMQKEQHGMAHWDELREFMETQKVDPSSVTSIEQCHTGQKISTNNATAQQGTVAIPISIPGKKNGYDA
jgi:proteasome-associated ATPase